MKKKILTLFGVILFFVALLINVKSVKIEKNISRKMNLEIGNTAFANIPIPIGKKSTKKNQCRVRITSKWCTGSDCLPIQE